MSDHDAHKTKASVSTSDESTAAASSSSSSAEGNSSPTTTSQPENGTAAASANESPSLSLSDEDKNTFIPYEQRWFRSRQWIFTRQQLHSNLAKGEWHDTVWKIKLDPSLNEYLMPVHWESTIPSHRVSSIKYATKEEAEEELQNLIFLSLYTRKSWESQRAKVKARVEKWKRKYPDDKGEIGRMLGEMEEQLASAQIPEFPWSGQDAQPAQQHAEGHEQDGGGGSH